MFKDKSTHVVRPDNDCNEVSMGAEHWKNSLESSNDKWQLRGVEDNCSLNLQQMFMEFML